MNFHKFSPFPTTPVTIFFIFIFYCTKCFCKDDEQYSTCSHPFDCGPIKNLSYPFWGGARPDFCGHHGFKLNCQTNDQPTIEIGAQVFVLLHLNQSTQTMTIVRSDLWRGTCTDKFINTTLNWDLFDYGPDVRNLTLYYGCSSEPPLGQDTFTCTVSGREQNTAFYAEEHSILGDEECYINFRVPVSGAALDGLIGSRNLTLGETLNGGFEVMYEMEGSMCSVCNSTGGICGSNVSDPIGFMCLCKDQPGRLICAGSGSSNKFISSGAVAIGIAIGLIVIMVASIFLCYCIGGKLSLEKVTSFWKEKTRNDRMIEDLKRNYEALTPKRYNYSDIKKMTNSFTDKLGQGGYGHVYKGKLVDGRLVAVKILNESNGNGEEFINEVVSISRTSHVNVVNLLGFCFERKKRALIYEFMPNGSLDKFIYNERSLEWEKLYEIAVGIARGLQYLHRGCNTRILHFDIKPQNILLDEDLNPKISDFGLAKLCNIKESHVSLMGARGTVGYIAPEVFSRNVGIVSHKSDVYSYGMMVLEMVGGRKNINLDVSKTSQIYFPNWVYNHLELGYDLRINGVLNEEHEEKARKMILVSLWCIQTNPVNRPSMSKVVEMLEGSLQFIKIPPKPLFFPTRSLHGSSTVST